MTTLASHDAYTGLYPELYSLDEEEGFYALPPVAGQRLIASVDSADFALLERTIELVVQAQAFSRAGLQAALRIPAESAGHLTEELETLGVIEAGDEDAPREVLVAMHDLALFLADVRLRRRAALEEIAAYIAAVAA